MEEKNRRFWGDGGLYPNPSLDGELDGELQK